VPASERRPGRPALTLALWLLPVACLAGGWQEFVRSPDEALALPERQAVVLAAGGAVEAEAVEAEAVEAEAVEAEAVDAEAVDAEAVCVACAAEVEADEKAKGPCAEEAGDCSKELAKIREDRIAVIDLDIRVGGRPGNDYPCECRLEGETYEPRRFATTMFTWKAAGNCHKPLYFEDWQLERYGHSHGGLADPFFSAAHFFVTLPVLPYKMGVELPWECVYPLGYYRPGSCSPWMVPAVPISLRGFAVEAATITGIVFLMP
jgi:hypothetical protein